MAKNDNLGDFLTDIANAIREKTGTRGSINAQDFASEIAGISTGGDTPTPDMPIIGDGKTYLYIKITGKGRMTVPLYFSQTVAYGVTIDWGDGSATQTLSGTGNKNATHTYADVGEYVISLNPSSGCSLGLGRNSSSYSVMGSTANKGIAYCNMLQAVEIGKNITSIGGYAFCYCYSLSNVVIPEGVTSISNNAFYYCYSLSSVVIPNSVTTIGNNAFYGCSSIRSIVIPKGVTSIGSSAFYNCYSLASIVIPNGVTNISSSLLYYCYAIASVTIPDSVTSIESRAFQMCSSIVSIVIPKGVKSIGDNAFSYMTGMAYYDFTQCTSVPTLGGTSVFASIASDCKIVVPDGLYNTWIAATNWASVASKIVKASEFTD